MDGEVGVSKKNQTLVEQLRAKLGTWKRNAVTQKKVESDVGQRPSKQLGIIWLMGGNNLEWKIWTLRKTAAIRDIKKKKKKNPPPPTTP